MEEIIQSVWQSSYIKAEPAHLAKQAPIVVTTSLELFSEMTRGRVQIDLDEAADRSANSPHAAPVQAARAETGPRILMVSIVDPASSLTGSGTVTRGIIKVLEGPGLLASVECLAIRPSSHHYQSLRQLGSFARSFLHAMPAKAAYTFSRSFRDRVLERAARDNCDLVVLNGSDLLWLDAVLPPSIPRLLVAHNVEHLLFAAQAETLQRSLPLLWPVLRWERRRMERFEVAGIRSVRNAIFLSTFDASHPQAGALASRTLVAPPLFSDPPARGPRPNTGRVEIGFVGNMAWWPNREGLSWFLSQVFPHVGRNVHLNLFGHGTERYARGLAQVTQHGGVDDPTEIWSRCDLMICPMHAGGGVSTKLAEAVYHGVPVLATSLAIRGLPLTDDPCITVSDSAEAWVDHLTSAKASGGLRISPALSDRFAVHTHREAVQQFVRDVIREG